MQRFLEFMHSFAGRVQAFAEGLGGPGLMLVAFVDSSFLTLPEVADILVVVFTIREPSRWWYFSGMTTLGSLAGSYVLFLVGRKGGEALLRRQFHERHVDRGLEWFKKYGALVLIIPAMLPPPMPFKIFVLLAGVSGVSRGPVSGRARGRTRGPLRRRSPAGAGVRRPGAGLRHRQRVARVSAGRGRADCGRAIWWLWRWRRSVE
jgi:membrane protein YqaA with SNARE-associated domain